MTAEKINLTKFNLIFGVLKKLLYMLSFQRSTCYNYNRFYQEMHEIFITNDHNILLSYLSFAAS